MSLEAFLAEVEKVESGSGSGTFTTIAKARVFFCWQGWTNGKSQLFEFEPGNDESETAARAECQAYINSGSNEYDQWPQKGICTHIYGDDVPTNAEGKFHWGDILDFVKKYESDLTAFGPENPNNELRIATSGLFTSDERALVSGPMPFNLVVEGIKANEKVTDWKEHWVKMSQEINQWSKAKGKKNKKGYDLRVHVIQHVYANEAEAKADVENVQQASASSQASNGQLSDKAIETWGGTKGTHAEAMTHLMKDLPKIKNLIDNAVNGVGMPKKSPADAQAHAASGYNIEVNDLALLGIEIIPF